MSNILNIVCYVPLLGMVLIMFTKKDKHDAIRWIANITAFIGFLVSIPTKFAEKATTRQQALAEMATDSQAGFARWIEDATSLASGKAA